MKAGWDELEVDFFRGEKLLESSRTFVIEALELRAVAAGDKSGVNSLVRLKDAGGSSGSHGFDQNRVGIIVVENQNVVVSSA